MALKIEALLDEDWKLARSGVSVDAGPTRIRQENAGPRDELEARARLISTGPLGYRLALAVLDFAKTLEEGEGDVEVPAETWADFMALAFKAQRKGEGKND